MLCEILNNEGSNTSYAPIIRAINLIENNLSLNISISELVKMCGVSETSFKLMFIDYTGGITPIEYRNILRINKAEIILYTEHVTAEYAAMTTGFNDLSYFYRIHRKYKKTILLSTSSANKNEL